MHPPRPYVCTQFDQWVHAAEAIFGWWLWHYLGAKLKMTQLENGIWAWGISPSKYVAQAVKNCAKHLTNKLNNHFCLPQWADNPFPYDYWPELDLSDHLDPDCSSFYQHLIGVMRWMVELGRIDILKSLSYPLTLHILAKDILRPHFISCLIWVRSIIHDLSLTQPIPKLIWDNFHNIIGPNSMEM